MVARLLEISVCPRPGLAGAFLLREVEEEVGDRAVEHGVLEVGGDFGERGKDEAAFVESRVGEGELWGG